MQETATAIGSAQAETGSQFLSFILGSEEYGIEILRVQEIRGYSAITPIPNTPPHIRGLINLRGTVAPVADLRAKFGMPAVEYNRFTVIILVAVSGKTVGLIVDAVSDVLNLAEDRIQPPPDLGSQVDVRFLRGVVAFDDRLVGVLDLDRLLGEDVAAAGAPVN
jgi:purine-binding chemotaxis protein CheW